MGVTDIFIGSCVLVVQSLPDMHIFSQDIQRSVGTKIVVLSFTLSKTIL